MKKEPSFFEEWKQTQEDLFEFELEGLVLDVTEQVCRYMEEAGLNRKQLAERMRVSRQFITKLLNGNPNLTLKTLLKLSRALGKEIKIHFTCQLA